MGCYEGEGSEGDTSTAVCLPATLRVVGLGTEHHPRVQPLGAEWAEGLIGHGTRASSSQPTPVMMMHEALGNGVCVCRSGTEDLRRSEGLTINRSLLTLDRVVTGG